MPIVKMTIHNDIHLPEEVVKRLNIGDERTLWVMVKNNMVILTPVDVEPRYSNEALDGLEKMVKKEKDKAIALSLKKRYWGFV